MTEAEKLDMAFSLLERLNPNDEWNFSLQFFYRNQGRLVWPSEHWEDFQDLDQLLNYLEALVTCWRPGL